MKKLIFGLATVAAMACLGGDAANRLITFSTKGPDLYADQTTVLDGERYALVYVVDGFGGITADGKAADANDTVLGIFSLAREGHCPTTVFQVDSSVADQLENTTATTKGYAVYLLDTRLAPTVDKDNQPLPRKLAATDATTGLPTAIAATTAVATDLTAGQMTGASATDVAAMATATPSVLPAGAEAKKPQVKAIRIDGAYVYITVANTLPSLQYNVAGGAKPDELKDSQAVRPVQGGATEDDEITIVAPKSDKGGFFKVQRN